jgi:hypothetical protein
MVEAFGHSTPICEETVPQFILDTSRQVHEHLPGNGVLEWSSLDAFTQGYIEALFFTETEPGTTRETWDRETQSSLPGDVGFADLAPEALGRIVADCAAFLRAPNRLLIGLCVDFSAEHWIDDVWTRAGRDYWYTRNGHGVGFWEDNRWPEAQGIGLDAAAKAAGGMDAYLGDDGKVHVS